MSENPFRKLDSGRLILGGTLIVIGILLILGPIFGVRWGDLLWPLFIIVPGLILCIFALSRGGQLGEGLMVPGSIVTMLGLLLFFQNITGLWETWAYAWALLAPTSIGLGYIVYGLVKGRPALVQTGRRVATVGIIIFLVGAAFFEGILNISGLGLGAMFVALLLIGLGVFFLIRAQLLHRRT